MEENHGKFLLDKQSISFKAQTNQTEISQGNRLICTFTGISIIPVKFKIEPLDIKDNFALKPKGHELQKQLYEKQYFLNIIDYSLSEISLLANHLCDSWIESIWKTFIDSKENNITISLTDEIVKEKLIEYNPTLFVSKKDIEDFCLKYNLKIEQFVVPGNYSQLEMELEGIAARLSSEIIFFRKKFFTELLIQKIDNKIFEFENVKNIIILKKNKDIYQKWKLQQVNELELVQKFVKSPYTFDDLEQYKNFKSLNDFTVKNYQQEELVSETFYWINNFPTVKKRFEIAVNYYKSNSDLRDAVDNLRLALEILLKEILNNQKSLENQLQPIGIYQEKLGIGIEIRNMFQKTLDCYIKFQNDKVKHNDKINNLHEVEFIFGLTMLFIRILIKPNKDLQNNK